MSREIKFRVWCKSSDRFELDNKMCFFIMGNLCNPEEINNENYVIQQYTGLKDKNNKEIYEGDIVKHWICLGPAGETQIVSEIKISAFGPNLEEWTYKNKLYPEVIGNIFEHPELLKQ